MSSSVPGEQREACTGEQWLLSSYFLPSPVALGRGPSIWMRACLSAHAWKGLLDHTALPKSLLVTFRFYIYRLVLANPATPWSDKN